jgi:glycosyltransferase involved in cell wall biosynthesis
LKPLHICYISQEFPPETGWGGIGAYTYEMGHGLVEQGHRVTIVSLAVNEEGISVDQGVEIHRIQPSPKWNDVRILWRLNRVWPGFAWAAMNRLKAIDRDHPIDLVEAAEGRADSFFVGFLPSRPKLIVRLHTARILVDQLNKVSKRKGGRRDYWLERQSISRANLLTAPSQAVVDLTNKWVPLNGHPVRVVPNPIDARLFSPRPSKRELELLFVGRLEHQKIFTLYEALPEILRRDKNVRVRFAGAVGNDLNGTSWQTRILDSVPVHDRSRLVFERIQRGAAADAYRRAAICVLPSFWENFPYAVLEAMACATPVVCTRNGGVTELIEDGVSGVLVPPESPADLADAICNLLKDPEKRRRLGLNGRRRVEELYSTERVIPSMLQVYNEVLNGSSQLS